jgi:hypothetical protein
VDTDPIDPPGTHYPDRREPAQHPPGPRAPEPVSHEPVQPRNWDDLLYVTRRLFRVARTPRADLLWGELEPQWLDWERFLVHYIRVTPMDMEDTNDVYVAKDRLATARRFLGR